MWAQQPQLILPIGHTNTINVANFSPDGKRVLTASVDNTAKLWDADNGNLLANLQLHKSAVQKANFSPDGKLFFTLSMDGMLILWRTETADTLYSISWEYESVYEACFSPDNKTIAVLVGTTLRFIELATKKIARSLDLSTTRVWSIFYSPDGKKLAGIGYENAIRVWDAASLQLIATLPQTFSPNFATFDPSSVNIAVTGSRLSKAYLWDVAQKKIRAILYHDGEINSLAYSADGRQIVTSAVDSTVRTWDAGTGKQLLKINEEQGIVRNASFSRDGKKIISASYFSIAVRNSHSGALVKSYNLDASLNGVENCSFSPDNERILVICGDYTVKIVSLVNDDIVADLSGYTFDIYAAQFSRDGKRIVTTSGDNSAFVWDRQTGKIMGRLFGHSGRVTAASFSPDDKQILTCSWDGFTVLWDANSDTAMKIFEDSLLLDDAIFSPDGKKIATISTEGIISIRSLETDSLLISFTAEKAHHLSFSPDGLRLLSYGEYWERVTLWEVATGKLIEDLNKEAPQLRKARFGGPVNALFGVEHSLSGKIRKFDPFTGKEIASFPAPETFMDLISETRDEKKFIVSSSENDLYILDAATGEVIHQLKGHTSDILSISISPDDKYILSAAQDNTCKIWDLVSGELLYTFFPVGQNDYLSVDAQSRFDGTKKARDLLYFTCGTETVALSQVKDQLWLPGLVERINNGEVIQTTKLEQLNICGLTPQVISKNTKSGDYRFLIKPRLGGLGESIVSINGIEYKRYSPKELKKTAYGYELVLQKSALRKYFSSGELNKISVKALTGDNAISSRSVDIDEMADSISKAAPNLFAIVIGISEYKDERLKLRYAAKDAHDFAGALELTARKFFDNDSLQHVFLYRCFTGPGHDYLPEKNTIHQVLSEIGKTAKPNDILLVFFAGHGKVNDKTHQFHFLTQEATTNTIASSLGDVSISSTELTDWIKPDRINVKKRVLIFDACYSGQAINDMVKIGAPGQGYAASRDDEKALQTKAIEKLNERAGLFILSASASNQVAYEMSRYEQGVLTYSLLQAIKQQPEILDDHKFLDVGRWFNAAGKSVDEILSGAASSQQAQVISTTNFAIGVVDDEVRKQIVLPVDKMMFSSSEFRHTRLRVDDLRLRQLVDRALDSLSADASAPLLFRPGFVSPEVYTISGDYEVNENEIVLSVLLLRGGTQILQKFDFSGPLADPGKLVTEIRETVTQWLKMNK